MLPVADQLQQGVGEAVATFPANGFPFAASTTHRSSVNLDPHAPVASDISVDGAIDLARERPDGILMDGDAADDENV